MPDTLTPAGPQGLPQRLRVPGRCRVMGVVNVTADSFSDGGRWLDPQAAIDHGLALAAQGADLIDVGGESTRPGAERVAAGEECARVLPVVAALAGAGVTVSIDTMRADTAVRAVAAGAVMVNDVSGGLADPDMLPALAELDAAVVLMHWRAHSHEMNRWARYGPDVTGDVIGELTARCQAAVGAGIAAQRLVLDPGLGFAKDAEHNWALLAALPRLRALGYPILIGASRKRFLGALLADGRGPRPVAERDVATAAVSVLAAEARSWAVRVHDVRSTRDALTVLAAWQDAGSRSRLP